MGSDVDSDDQPRKQSFSELVSQFAAEVEEAYSSQHRHSNGLLTLPNYLENLPLLQESEFMKTLNLYNDEESGSGLSDEEPLSPLCLTDEMASYINKVGEQTSKETHACSDVPTCSPTSSSGDIEPRTTINNTLNSHVTPAKDEDSPEHVDDNFERDSSEVQHTAQVSSSSDAVFSDCVPCGHPCDHSFEHHDQQSCDHKVQPSCDQHDQPSCDQHDQPSCDQHDQPSCEQHPCELHPLDSVDSIDHMTSTELELQTSFHVWYQTDLSREHSEELLIKQPIGTFYIRGSSKTDHYALSVHISTSNPRVEHYLVHDYQNVLQMENSASTFPNFIKLLAFFAENKTYSATTGIPVQLKIPRLISTSGNPTSVYDQIDLAPREHEQASGILQVSRNTAALPRNASALPRNVTSHLSHVSSQYRGNASSPPQPQGTVRPKSVHGSCASSNVVSLKDADINGSAPPKPPKPKHYRHNYNLPDEKDLIYINLDKGPGKMLDVLSSTQNNLSECRVRSLSCSASYKENKFYLPPKQGPAIFHAPPPPPCHYDEDTPLPSPTHHYDNENNLLLPPHPQPVRYYNEEVGDNKAVFIAPSPPTHHPPASSEESDDDYELGSCTGSLYSSKNSVDLCNASESVRFRPVRAVAARSSVMEKVRSRVFKAERNDRRSVRTKLCQKLSPHVLRLTDTQEFTFSERVTTFVAYIRQQHQKVPDRLLTQVREFMCNIKQELVSHRSEALEDLLNRSQRKGTQPCTKVNDIVEGILVKAVIWPLRVNITNTLMEQDKVEAEKLKNAMAVALSKPLLELGINQDMFCGGEIDWSVPVDCLREIPNHYSPIKKLERLLACVNAIYSIVRDQSLEKRGVPRSMGADEFLPLFIYVLSLSGLYCAGQEVSYMQYLLDPCLLIGEPGYYLTTLASSVILLKSLEFEQGGSVQITPTLGHLQSMLQIFFTDPDMQEIAYKTLPINQNTTTEDVLSTLATKFRLDSIEHYGIFKVENDRETMLAKKECPQFIKNEWLVESLERDINSYFTFHRINP